MKAALRRFVFSNLRREAAFVDAFKQTFSDIETVCFEKDLLTGKILSHLNPDDKVHISGFEEIENRPDSRFDAAASNISFGNTAVFDVSFSKSDDSVKRQATALVHKRVSAFTSVCYRAVYNVLPVPKTFSPCSSAKISVTVSKLSNTN
jgi:hypothetical protein